MPITLITGATGYIGRHLVAHLVAHGDRPRCLVRQDAPSEVLPADKVDLVIGNITAPPTLPAAMEGADAVVHLAAVVANVKETGAVSYARINDQGTANLVKAARTAGVTHFIYLSGLNTVPGAEGSYIRTRWNAEQHVKNSGLPYSILEPSILFGDRAPFFAALTDLARRAPVVPVPGNGKLRFQPVWVEDVVTCIITLLAEGARDEIIPIGGPAYFSYDDLLDLIFRTLRKRRLKLHLPMPVMKASAALMQMALPKPPVTTATFELFSSDNVATLDAIPRRFGFQPRSLTDELAASGGV